SKPVRELWLAFWPDGSKLAATAWDELEQRVWDMTGEEPKETVRFQGNPALVGPASVFLSDGKRLVAIVKGGGPRLMTFDIETLPPTKEPVPCLFSSGSTNRGVRGGGRFFVGHESGLVRVVDEAPEAPGGLKFVPLRENPVGQTVALSPD